MKIVNSMGLDYKEGTNGRAFYLLNGVWRLSRLKWHEVLMRKRKENRTEYLEEEKRQNRAEQVRRSREKSKRESLDRIIRARALESCILTI